MKLLKKLKDYKMIYSTREIKKLKNNEGLFLLLVQSNYNESSGYEKPGEFGSRTNYLETYQLTEKELTEWLLENPNAEYKVFKSIPMKIEKKVSVVMFDDFLKQ